MACFTDANVEWLARALALKGGGPAGTREARALAIFAAVEGAQLVARSRGDVAAYDATIATMRASGLIP